MNAFRGASQEHSSTHIVEDTIAAVSTPPGPGGIGVVRISGPGSLEIASKVFSPLAGTGHTEPRRAVFGHVHPPLQPEGLPAETIDQAVWLYFAGPASYTGEDTVELTCHGGPLIMAALLEAVLAAGARPAEPGEFTRRAYVNGRMDLSQAEAVASLIFAATDAARRVMFRQMEGAVGRTVQGIRERLLSAKVIVESAIDFPEEEDVAHLDLEALWAALEQGLREADGLLATAREGTALKNGLSVAIVGTPNVGKSSLLNALLEEDRAIVHELAGTTRDFIEGVIDAGGIPVRVVDTAGIREGADSVEIEGILRTRRVMEGADLLLVVLDGSRRPGRADLGLLEETAAAPRVVVFNKCDLPDGPVRPAVDGVRVSALTGEGVGGLRQRIHDLHVGTEGPGTPNEAILTTARQVSAMEKVKSACQRAVAALESVGLTAPELLAVDLDEALAGIGELTGEVTSEEVLSRIFESFCIGK